MPGGRVGAVVIHNPTKYDDLRTRREAKSQFSYEDIGGSTVKNYPNNEKLVSADTKKRTKASRNRAGPVEMTRMMAKATLVLQMPGNIRIINKNLIQQMQQTCSLRKIVDMESFGPLNPGVGYAASIRRTWVNGSSAVVSLGDASNQVAGMHVFPVAAKLDYTVTLARNDPNVDTQPIVVTVLLLQEKFASSPIGKVPLVKDLWTPEIDSTLNQPELPLGNLYLEYLEKYRKVYQRRFTLDVMSKQSFVDSKVLPFLNREVMIADGLTPAMFYSGNLLLYVIATNTLDSRQNANIMFRRTVSIQYYVQ